MAISRNPKDVEARMTRINEKLAKSPGQALMEDAASQTQQQIRRVIASWGKRTCYRYLRDHGMLEAFTECLPLQDYEATDEDTIVNTLQAGWDDFSPAMLAEMENWQIRSSEAALTPRLATYAARLYQSGYLDEAREVLRMAETIDSSGSAVIDRLAARNLTTDHIVHAVGDERGFGPEHLAGRVESVEEYPDGTISVAVVVPQRDEHYQFDVPGDRIIQASRLVKPQYSRALRIAALRKLIEAEATLEGNEAAQSQVARVRYLLAESLKEESAEVLPSNLEAMTRELQASLADRVATGELTEEQATAILNSQVSEWAEGQ